MSADKYAQFIAEQQRKLSVSGVNTVDLHEGAKPEVSVHSGMAHVKNAKGETVASYSRKQHGADFMKKANAHMAKLKEEALDEKELSPKQKKIAAMAGDKDKIEGEDFAKLRAQKEEVELISIEEQAYLEEMVGKGKLPDILMHHKDNMLHHAKMVDHHNMMADKSEQVGDTVGFDHHLSMAMSHEMDHQHHKVRYDHAAGLKARSKAQKEMKAAKDAMDAASKKIADAKAWKRDA